MTWYIRLELLIAITALLLSLWAVHIANRMYRIACRLAKAKGP